MLTVKPLPGAFGAEIRGADIARGADERLLSLLTETLYENRVVVIRDQRLNEDQYLGFGRLWGEPIPHVLDHMRMAGYPEMLVVGNTEEKDKTDAIRNGAALWHTDQSYERVPASATMLYSVKAPARGGETQFCDMVAAYDDLDDTTRKTIASLQLAHKYGKGKRRPDEHASSPIINDDQDDRLPTVYHPLVLPHPITGRKALYALGHGAHAIRGMDDSRAESLIEQLRNHALQEKYIYRHRYALGDIAIWDTLQTMHCAVPIGVASSAADARLLWRISVRGRPAIRRRTKTATATAQVSTG